MDAAANDSIIAPGAKEGRALSWQVQGACGISVLKGKAKARGYLLWLHFLRVVASGEDAHLANVIFMYTDYIPKHGSWQTFRAFWRGQLCEKVTEEELSRPHG